MQPEALTSLPLRDWSHMDLTDEQWRLIQPLIPPPSPALRGRPPIDERRVLDGILWKLRKLAPWSDLPSSYPSWQTCYRRYHLWQRTGIFGWILSALWDDLGQRGGFDLHRAMHDETIRAAHRFEDYRIVIDSRWQGTWQLSTASLFLALSIKRLDQILDDGRTSSITYLFK